ncbi:ATP-dependent helicase [Sphingomonas koreensis]|jgi:superfamily II DNA/RNA helicase|uniref:DEAD-box ATP-dependent RNA helicase RhpA n=1 Tax=Sphingomonas koreensis TaxID=93064 RepID=A0A1L6J8I8_9SPHN|nr:DEAD/DEAH box helicase [Sphingomonas koreensis]APR52252.1 DEAD/DEAH box helicase [Sphingomonas koreensis]MDC7811383.1 DEAD/DEAH box helicase [Sphingomonas koreensis]PJI88307.1 superfamily II DNA/RNA helicase [Sphingomonas koreensis]RSU19854.1 ATP-dependent helicase [Sphingomonas koreensis]RSU26641.1 ATP-dependent helicase [Sphingomonas koreensis]
MSFADLGLSDELLKAVTEAGYTDPTPIQRQAIPSVLMMRDLIGIAQTGTGKTASFVLPMIDVLAEGRSRARMPRSLILEPTRELAAQVAENFEKYGTHHKLSMALLIGGVQMGDQVKALEKGVDVLIATPGRLMDLFERGKILLTGCNLLVIDEADRMLDMGFIPDIENICTKLPANRQTLLFSATMPPPIKKLADKFLSNPKTIEVARPASTNTNITQWLVPVANSAFEKRRTLRRLIEDQGVATAIIFCNRKTTVRELNKSLKKHGYRSAEIHGDMDQSSRIAELDRFKAGEVNILVASDVAARGLDIKGVSHVFNFDAPWHPDDYVHRIGRTGRAGATGTAFTLVSSADAEAIDNIEKLQGQKIDRMGALPVEDVPAEEKKGRGRKGSKPKADAPKPDKKAADKARSDEPREERRPEAREPRRDDRPRRDRDRDRRRDSFDDGPDDGWNGPVPDFLNFTIPA